MTGNVIGIPHLLTTLYTYRSFTHTHTYTTQYVLHTAHTVYVHGNTDRTNITTYTYTYMGDDGTRWRHHVPRGSSY